MNYLEVPRLVPLATSSLNELKDESRLIPSLADQLSVIVQIELGASNP
jgi:hypothetical protein